MAPNASGTSVEATELGKDVRIGMTADQVAHARHASEVLRQKINECEYTSPSLHELQAACAIDALADEVERLQQRVTDKDQAITLYAEMLDQVLDEIAALKTRVRGLTHA